MNLDVFSEIKSYIFGIDQKFKNATMINQYDICASAFSNSDLNFRCQKRDFFGFYLTDVDFRKIL